MKNLIIGILVIAALVFGGRLAWQKFGSAVSGDEAERRVKVALAGMKDGGDEQAAASMYFEGVNAILDDTRLAVAWDRWMDWRRERGLGTGVRSYTVGEVDTSMADPVVSVTIDGDAHRIAAPSGEPLRWVD